MSTIEALAVGTELLQYRLTARIGPSVWRASDTRNGKEAAVKILTRQLPKDPDRREQVVRDTRLGAALYHPFLVPIVDVIEAGDVLAMVMSFVEGEPLARRIGGTPLQKAELFNIAFQIADVVKFLQARNMIHGNINADSVLVTPAGQVKLAGLNAYNLLTRRAGASSPVYQQKGNDTASIAYMAPEQISGQSVDARADVFSIGVVCYQMATGSLPWVAKSAADLAHEVVEGQPQSPRLFNPNVDQGVMALIGRCLFKDPYRRHADARAVVDDIAKLFPDAVRNANELAARERSPVAESVSPETRQSILLLADLNDADATVPADAKAATAAAARLQQLVGEAVYLFDGSILDPFGHRVVAELPSIDNAVQAASKIQFDFSPDQLEGESLPVRILLHAGEVQSESGRVTGAAVEKGFAAVSQLPPLEIFASEDFARLGRKTLRLRDAGARGGMKLYAVVRPEPEPEVIPVSSAKAETNEAPAASDAERPRRGGNRLLMISVGGAVIVLLAAVGAFLLLRSSAAPVRKKVAIAPAAVVRPVVDRTAIETARAAAREALSKGDLATAFGSYATILAADGADAEALNVVARYAAAVGDTGRFSAAASRLERLQKGMVTVHAPDLLLASGNIDGAIDQYYDVETKEPANPALALKIGRIAVLRRTMTIADIELAKLQKQDTLYGYPLLKAYIAAQQNARAEAEQNLKEAAASSQPGDDFWTSAAEIHAILGQNREVIAALQKAAGRREPTPLYILNNPLFAYLRSDPSFQKVRQSLTAQQDEIRAALARITM